MVKRFEIKMLLAVFCLLLTAGQFTLLAQEEAARTFDDDDPSNDPNVCYDSPDPNCDWERGWFQAAVNMGHIEIQAAQTAFPDMHITDWLPEEFRAERERQLEEAQKLYEDDDPTNDPNLCYEAIDPAVCDWVAGYYGAISNIAMIIQPDEAPSGALEIIIGEADQYWLEAMRKADELDPPFDPDGPQPFLIIRGLCPPGTVPVSIPGVPGTTCE